MGVGQDKIMRSGHEARLRARFGGGDALPKGASGICRGLSLLSEMKGIYTMQLKHTILALAAAGMLTTQAYASEAQVEAAIQAAQPVAAFTEADMASLFDNANQPMQLAALSDQEMKETEGAWVWWAAAGVVGGAMNTIGYIGSNRNWTYGGAAYSFLTGASGGLIAALPGGNLARLGYGALGAYTAAQPWGGYSWSRW